MTKIMTKPVKTKRSVTVTSGLIYLDFTLLSHDCHMAVIT